MYLRVSRADQRPEAQEADAKLLIEARGWKLVDTYTDHGISGSKDRRPDLDRLLRDARRRRFDVVVVYRGDRLFRSMRHFVNTLAEFESLGVAFVSATEAWDTTSPQGRLTTHLMQAMAEYEKGILIERTVSGMNAARRRGARIGRPRRQVDLDAVQGLRDKGLSFDAIAEKLGVGRATIRRALARSSR